MSASTVLGSALLGAKHGGRAGAVIAGCQEQCPGQNAYAKWLAELLISQLLAPGDDSGP